MSEPIVLEFKDRQSWLEGRRKLLTASDAAGALGLNRWSSPLSVYAEKTGALEPDEEDERIRWGRLLQPVLGQEFERETGRKVVDAGQYTVRVHRDLPWLGATLDFLWNGPEGRGVLETKCSEYEWTEEPPLEAQVQLQIQLAVTGLTRGSLAGLFRGHKFVWQDQEVDAAFIDPALVRLDKFWWHVQKGIPPEVTSSKGGTLDALKALYPKNLKAEAIGLPGWASGFGAEWDTLKAAVKAGEQRLEDIEAIVKAEMGEAWAAALPDGSGWTWKAHKRHEQPKAASDTTVRRFLRWKP